MALLHPPRASYTHSGLPTPTPKPLYPPLASCTACRHPPPHAYTVPYTYTYGDSGSGSRKGVTNVMDKTAWPEMSRTVDTREGMARWGRRETEVGGGSGKIGGIDKSEKHEGIREEYKQRKEENMRDGQEESGRGRKEKTAKETREEWRIM